jgi:hypothetical protein
VLAAALGNRSGIRLALRGHGSLAEELFEDVDKGIRGFELRKMTRTFDDP